MVDLRALKSRNFALGCFFSFITGIGIFATIYLTPLFLARVRGFSALQIGEAVFSTGMFQVCAIPFYTMLARRIDLRWLMMFGLACFALSMWNFTPITHDWGWRELLLPQAFRGFSQQFAVAPTVTLTLGGAGAGAAEAGVGAVQPDAQSRRRDRHRRVRHDPERPHQPALPAPGRASEQRQPGDAAISCSSARRTRPRRAAAMRCTATLRRCGNCGRSRCARRRRRAFADAFFVIALCFALATVMVPLMRKIAVQAAPSRDAH